MRRPAVRLLRNGLRAGSCMLLLLASACGIHPFGGNPEQMLDHAISGLSGKDNFSFEGETNVAVDAMPMERGVSFAGNVTGHNQVAMRFVHAGKGDAGLGAMQPMEQTRPVVFSRRQDQWIVADSDDSADAQLLLRWNPLLKLERLNKMKKQVESERVQEGARQTVLNVRPEADDMTAAVKEELKTQLQTLDAGRKLAELKQRLRLTDLEVSRMRGEVEQSVAQASSRLNEILGSLLAEGHYRIWVDRVSSLPRRMQVVTEMTYSSLGQAKRETTQVDYRFGE